MLDRNQIAALIFDRLNEEKETLISQFEASKKEIGFFYLDEVLPKDLVNEVHNAFPKPEETYKKKSLKQHKHVAAQMNHYNPILEEVIYAFQDSRVVQLISEITGIASLIPDDQLYAGGISMMKKNSFLNPHLDNSHDNALKNFRALNLLYYVSPDWNLENGGNLELWNKGLKTEPITIVSKYNRLAVMATHNFSWHSVSSVVVDKRRCCVSNYYFSPIPIDNDASFHVTTFRGRSNQTLRDIILQVDNFLRMQVRKVFKKGIRSNPHIYKKDKS